MPSTGEIDLNALHKHLVRLRGDAELHPDASIIIPVNAQKDLTKVLQLVTDICGYGGEHSAEVIVVANNYPPGNPPEQIKTFRSKGLRVVDVPDVMSLDQAGAFKPAFRARVPGVQAARSTVTIHFDADCRILDATALVDWYIAKLNSGVQLAYSNVGHYELRDSLSLRVRFALHHMARWIKRNLLGIPTARGSNYAINRSLFLQLYSGGKVTEDLQIGPAVKLAGGKVIYSGERRLKVLTSGRKFYPGWIKIFRYFRYRLRYNYLRIKPTPEGDELVQMVLSKKSHNYHSPNK